MKGNLLLSSTKENEVELFKSDRTLEGIGSNVMEHAIGLILKKFAVVVPQEDLATVHYLPRGIIVRFNNLRPGSAWSKLCEAIKSGNKGGDQ